MFNFTGGSNSNTSLNLKGPNQGYSSMGVLGQIQSHRKFSTTTSLNCNRMGINCNKIGMTEISAKIINSDNGYPNNMRRTSAEESTLITSEIITVMETTAGAASPGCMGPAHVLGIIGCRPMKRTVSECPSEDSYIVFESCDTDLDDFIEDCSESDSEVESDDDIECKEGATKDITNGQMTDVESKKYNIKMVHFASDEHLVTVHTMCAWKYAYRASRKGHWEEYARDRARFNRRIETCQDIIETILQKDHRERIYQERFAPAIATNSLEALNANASDHNLIKNKKKRPKRNRRRRNGKKKKKNRHKFSRNR